MADLVFTDLPAIGPLLARGVAGSIGAGRGARPIPRRAAIVASHRPDIARLSAYARVCGFTLRDHVPPTWLHVLTFPLQAALMAERDFPYPLAGLVHASNTMTLHRPVSVGEELALVVRAGNARPHRKGALFDLLGEVRGRGGETVWTGTSSYLALGGKVEASASSASTEAEPAASDLDLPAPSQQWRLPGDLGRQYATVSGDVNPIHLNALTARLFGFKRPIVHGMWTHARALAALEPRLPEAYTVDVEFKRPILLPNKVGFATDGSAFAVLNREGKPYLSGAVA
ncbi:MAG: MaoC/PaaZ C-terminal domain-containing protein [Propionibacteriaceae bacterium]|nr:MaoC/PaaZ C-terminal domain-containing protein [Propionibacteriaceae bacterium]